MHNELSKTREEKKGEKEEHENSIKQTPRAARMQEEEKKEEQNEAGALGVKPVCWCAALALNSSLRILIPPRSRDINLQRPAMRSGFLSPSQRAPPKTQVFPRAIYKYPCGANKNLPSTIIYQALLVKVGAYAYPHTPVRLNRSISREP